MTHIKWEISGNLTSEKTAALRKQFEKILRRQLNVILDLSSLDDIDLSGFNLLISMYMMAKRADVQLLFQSVGNQKLWELATRTKFDYVFRKN